MDNLIPPVLAIIVILLLFLGIILSVIFREEQLAKAEEACYPYVVRANDDGIAICQLPGGLEIREYDTE